MYLDLQMFESKTPPNMVWAALASHPCAHQFGYFQTLFD